MKVINEKTHGYLDYLVVLIFLGAPGLLHLSVLPAAISYSLAGIHLLLTLSTDFSMGAWKVVPLNWHGTIELLVGPVLIILPFILGFGPGMAEYFYVSIGAVITVVWFLTDFSPSKSPESKSLKVQ